ncbi:MAG: hypothetical protein KJO59_05275 [Ignavibacteria bacterium]|nr:hypothetical protein [Ignavibacteria bacterium]
MKIVKRVLLLFSIGLLYIIVREFLELYYYLSNINPILTYLFILLVILIIGYFVIIPLYQILKLPKNLGPCRNKSLENTLIERRLKTFRSNPNLNEYNFSMEPDADSRKQYSEVIKYLEKKCESLRKTRVANLFYSSAISQNGFIDAILILSASINIVKETFVLFNGRVSNRDLLVIAKHTYYSIAIGGSEIVEYPVEEIYSKLASEGMKEIPFIDKILGSIVDGFVNATLLTRISLITENYCKFTYIESDKEIYPGTKSIVESTKNITSDVKNKIVKSIVKLVKEGAMEKTLKILNPLGYVMERAVDKYVPEKSPNVYITKKGLKFTSRLIGNPITTGIEEIIKLRKSKR